MRVDVMIEKIIILKRKKIMKDTNYEYEFLNRFK